MAIAKIISKKLEKISDDLTEVKDAVINPDEKPPVTKNRQAEKRTARQKITDSKKQKEAIERILKIASEDLINKKNKKDEETRNR